MRAALAVFSALLLARAPGFWGYLLRHPSSVDGTSARLWATHLAWPAALATGTWAAAWALGRRVTDATGVRPRDPLDEAVAALLGMAFLAAATFALGWAGALRPFQLAAVAAAGAAAMYGSGRPLLPGVPRISLWTGAAGGWLAFAAACVLMDAASPPALWDVRAYHLALPEASLRVGKDVALPWMIHSHWPHAMESMYALALVVGRDGAAAFVHAGAALLFVAMTARTADLVAGPAAAWTAALLLAGQPALLREAGTAHSDAACAASVFASAWLLGRWRKEGDDGTLACAGLLAGGAAAVKLTGLAAVAGGAAFVIVASRRLREPGLFVAAAGLLIGPWLAKSYMETGSPAWPLLPGGGPDAVALATRFLRSNRWDLPPPTSLLLHDGPLFLLAPAAALAIAVPVPSRRAGPAEVALRWSAVFFAILAWRNNDAWRLLMPAWPVLALAAGRRAEDLVKRGGPRRAAAALVAAAAAAPIAALSPNNTLFAVVAPRPSSALDADRRALWADRTLEGLPGFYADAAAALTPGARVLLFREVRGYGAGFDYIWGDPMNQALLDYRALDPDALYARLRSLGVTHVLDHPGSALYREDPGYYDRRTLALMAECLRRHAAVERERDGFALYRLL